MGEPSYEEVLEESIKLSREALEALRGGEGSLQDIQRRMLVDNIAVIRSRNSHRQRLINLRERYEADKAKGQSKAYKNMKLANWKRRRVANEQKEDRLDSLLDEVPGVEFDEIESLGAEADELRRAFEDGRFEEYEIGAELRQQVEEAVRKSSREKFRLVEMNDVYYESEARRLGAMQRKWRKKLEELQSFVKVDAKRVVEQLEKEREGV